MNCPVRMGALLLALATGSPALLAQAPPPVLTTTGVGRVAVKPDRARLTISVQTQNRVATLAADSNDRRLTAILARLRAMPWLDSIRVTEVTVTPRVEGYRGPILGYDATATIEARLRDLTKIAAVFDGAIAGGATSVGEVQFESDSTDAGRQRALVEAFRNSREQAAALALAAGGHLGPPIRVTTSPQMGLMAGFAGASSSFDEVTVRPGRVSQAYGYAGHISVGTDPDDVVATAFVNVEWRLDP